MTQERTQSRIGIIGAGLTGLVAADKLQQAGFDVLVLESTLHPGGMLSSFRMGSTQIEYIYHHIFTSDEHIMSLLKDLNLDRRLTFHESREALVSQGKVYPFSTPLDLLKFSPIPLSQRLQTGLAVLRAGQLGNWQELESQTAAQWLRQSSGDRAYERIWKPLLKSKFDQDAEKVSAVWIWNKFKLRGSSRQKGSGKSSLGYLTGSFSIVVDELVKRIERNGGQILTGQTAMNIRRQNTKSDCPAYQIACVQSDCKTSTWTVDGIVATTSGRQFSNFAAGLNLPDDYMAKVRGVQYKGDLCLILRLSRGLSDKYWTTCCDDLPFVVVVEHTNLISPDAYGGHVIYLSRYLDASNRLWTEPDGEIYRQFVRALQKVYPAFSTCDVIDWRLRRIRYAQPVIGCNYSQNFPAMDTPDPSVKLAGMAQIYPEDRGMNYAVRLGHEAADSIIRQMREDLT